MRICSCEKEIITKNVNAWYDSELHKLKVKKERLYRNLILDRENVRNKRKHSTIKTKYEKLLKKKKIQHYHSPFVKYKSNI